MPPRPEARQWAVFRSGHPRPFGWLAAGGYVENNWTTPRDKPCVIGRFALVYLLEGGGYFKNAAGVDRSVSAGDLILLFPDVAHAYGQTPGLPWHEVYLHFDGPVFHLWRREGLLDPARPIYRFEPISHGARQFDALLEPLAAGRQPTIRDVCRLQDILATALTMRQARGLTAQDRAWLDRAKALLAQVPDDAEPRECWDAVTRSLGTGYESFRKKFTRLEGIPPARYRMNRLIERACDLVQQPGLPIKQIAARLGFANEFYFSRRFKQVMGVSPRAYRRQSVFTK